MAERAAAVIVCIVVVVCLHQIVFLYVIIQLSIVDTQEAVVVYTVQ